MPWRNGGGSTRELATWPDAETWRWRMSVAQVQGRGPFSRFDGVQRWFAVLAGAGVRLSLQGQAHELTCLSEPFSFDGGTPVDCELLGGATQDFNLMVRAGAARMQRLAGAHGFLLNAATTVAVYAIEDEAKLALGRESLVLPRHSLAWRTLPSGAGVRVESADALWMEIDL